MFEIDLVLSMAHMLGTIECPFESLSQLTVGKALSAVLNILLTKIVSWQAVLLYVKQFSQQSLEFMYVDVLLGTPKSHY